MNLGLFIATTAAARSRQSERSRADRSAERVAVRARRVPHDAAGNADGAERRAGASGDCQGVSRNFAGHLGNQQQDARSPISDDEKRESGRACGAPNWRVAA